jgi:hypothetical protein
MNSKARHFGADYMVNSGKREQAVASCPFPVFLSSSLRMGRGSHPNGRGYTIFETLSPAFASDGTARAGSCSRGQNSPAGLCGGGLSDGQFVLKTAIELPRIEETKQA